MSVRRVTARRMTSAVPDVRGAARTGVVHSVFANSFNVRFGAELMNLGPVSRPLSAIGVGLSDPCVLTSELHEGDRVVIRERLMRFYPMHSLPVSVDLSAVEMVDVRLPDLADHSCLASLEQELREWNLESRIGLTIDATGREHLTRARAGLPLSTWGDWFVGRGLGLTPAGDDILLGYEFARRCMGSVLDVSVAELLEGRTTDISTAGARALRKGYVNEPMARVLNAAMNGDPRAMKPAIAQVMSVGHTSGCDHLFGMALGIQST